MPSTTSLTQSDSTNGNDNVSEEKKNIENGNGTENSENENRKSGSKDEVTENENGKTEGNDNIEKSGTSSGNNEGQIDNNASEESFDVGDPDELIKQLDHCELTDQDREKLLDEAYKMNIELKKALKEEKKNRKTAFRLHLHMPPVSNKATSSSVQRNRTSKPTGEVYKRPHVSRSMKNRPPWDDRFYVTNAN